MTYFKFYLVNNKKVIINIHLLIFIKIIKIKKLNFGIIHHQCFIFCFNFLIIFLIRIYLNFEFQFPAFLLTNLKNLQFFTAINFHNQSQISLNLFSIDFVEFLDFLDF